MNGVASRERGNRPPRLGDTVWFAHALIGAERSIMTSLLSVRREQNWLELRFSDAEVAKTEYHVGGTIWLQFDSNDKVVALRTARMGPAEMQVISDILRRHDLTLDRLARDPELTIA
jgi:hypothetical protein